MLLNRILSFLLVAVVALFSVTTLMKMEPHSSSHSGKNNEDPSSDQDDVLGTLSEDVSFVKEESKEKQEGDSAEENQEESGDNTGNLDESVNTLLYVSGTSTPYCYSMLNEDEKRIYNAIENVARHSHITDYSQSFFTSMNPETSECWNEIQRVYESLIKDHPEYFGFYWSTEWNYRYYSNPNSEGKYQVECKIISPYKEYESEVTQFNEAVSEFLSDIDRTQRPEQIALAIHDKLMDTVEYDYDALENKDDEYVYTAYGVLVKNKKGQKNKAVCEGYSMAFEYLCQLSGLDVTVIHGDAGDSMDDLGPHAWNAVKLDGDWYEVDSTWNDNVGTRARTINDAGEYRDVTDAINADDDFYNKVSHVFFLLTTEEMAHRAPAENACTYNSDRIIYYMCGDEDYHIRSGKESDSTADLMPTAEGTFYSYDSIIAE